MHIFFQHYSVDAWSCLAVCIIFRGNLLWFFVSSFFRFVLFFLCLLFFSLFQCVWVAGVLMFLRVVSSTMAGHGIVYYSLYSITV